MARLTVTSPNRDDTARKIEDKVRALPANQGKNDNAMWLAIDTEIAQAVADGSINPNTTYLAVNKHGKA